MSEHNLEEDGISLSDVMCELRGFKTRLETLNSDVQSHGRQIADLSLSVTEVLTRYAKKMQDQE